MAPSDVKCWRRTTFGNPFANRPYFWLACPSDPGAPERGHSLCLGIGEVANKPPNAASTKWIQPAPAGSSRRAPLPPPRKVTVHRTCDRDCGLIEVEFRRTPPSTINSVASILNLLFDRGFHSEAHSLSALNRSGRNRESGSPQPCAKSTGARAAGRRLDTLRGSEQVPPSEKLRIISLFN